MKVFQFCEHELAEYVSEQATPVRDEIEKHICNECSQADQTPVVGAQVITTPTTEDEPLVQ